MAGILPLSVREGLQFACCQQCSARETAERKLLKCGGCKATKYCSAECQRKAWPEHKKVCKAQRSNLEGAKELYGKTLVKSKKKWITDFNFGLTVLVHHLLGDRTGTHVVRVEQEYQPGNNVEFKIVGYTVISLQELQAAVDEVFTTLMQTISRHRETLTGGEDVIGYAILEGVGPRMIVPLGKHKENDVSDVQPEEIVEGINTGSLISSC